MATQLLVQERGTTLNKLIHQWDRRLRLQQISLWLPRCLMPGLVIGIALAAISRMRPFLPGQQILLITAALLGIGIAAMLAVVWFWPRSTLKAARRFDIAFDLKERVSTALELLDGRIRANDELIGLQLDDALEQARIVRAGQHLPLIWTRRDWGIVLLLVAILALAILLPNPQSQTLSASTSGNEIAKTVEDELQKTISQVAADPSLTPEQRQELLEALQASAESLKEPNISPEEALATLSTTASELQAQADQFNQRQQAEQAALSAANQMLSNSANQNTQEAASQQPSESAQKDLADTLDKIQQNLSTMSSSEMQSAANALQNAANQLQQTNPQAAQALQQAAQQLQQGNQAGAQQALQQAAQQLQQDAQNAQNQQSSAQQLSQAAQTIQQAANPTNQQSQNQQSQQSQQQSQNGQQNQNSQQNQSGQQQGPQNQNGQQSQGQQQGQQLQGGQQQGQSQQQGAQQGQGSNGQQSGQNGQQGQSGQQGQTGQQGSSQQDGQSASSQSGQGSQNGQGQPAQGQGGQSSGAGDNQGDAGQNSSQGQPGGSPGQNNNPDGEGQGTFDPVYAPQHIGGQGTQQIQLDPNASNQPVQEGNFSNNPTGNTSVPYNQVFSDYSSAANQALENDYIPLGMRDVVRDYFSSLEPGQSANSGSRSP